MSGSGGEGRGTKRGGRNRTRRDEQGWAGVEGEEREWGDGGVNDGEISQDAWMGMSDTVRRG